MTCPPVSREARGREGRSVTTASTTNPTHKRRLTTCGRPQEQQKEWQATARSKDQIERKQIQCLSPRSINTSFSSSTKTDRHEERYHKYCQPSQRAGGTQSTNKQWTQGHPPRQSLTFVRTHTRTRRTGPGHPPTTTLTQQNSISHEVLVLLSCRACGGGWPRGPRRRTGKHRPRLRARRPSPSGRC